MSLPIVKISGTNYYKVAGENILKELFSLLPDKVSVKCSTLHWTAGNYNQFFSDYQVNISKDNYILVASNVAEWSAHQHTYMRNSNNIGISFAAMFHKIKYPVTNLMIENAAKTWAVIKHKYNLSWDVFKDHAYYSTIDKYPPAHVKIDCRTLYLENGKFITLTDKVLQKAKWYHQKYLAVSSKILSW